MSAWRALASPISLFTPEAPPRLITARAREEKLQRQDREHGQVQEGELVGGQTPGGIEGDEQTVDEREVNRTVQSLAEGRWRASSTGEFSVQQVGKPRQEHDTNNQPPIIGDQAHNDKGQQH